MALTPLTALSPLDGRYSTKVEPLRQHFSELGLIRYRVQVEVEWLKMLAAEPAIREIPAFSRAALEQLDAIVSDFSEADGAAVKTIEARTNHDVKAIEYFLKEKLGVNAEIAKVAEFIHFACTSEDINNVCHALMLKAARDEIMLPALGQIIERLAALAHELADAAMLAHTHGQPASPTTLGKEFANVVSRLRRARDKLAAVGLLGKLNGAVGNYNAHLAACPGVDWEKLGQAFGSRTLRSTENGRAAYDRMSSIWVLDVWVRPRVTLTNTTKNTTHGWAGFSIAVWFVAFAIFVCSSSVRAVASVSPRWILPVRSDCGRSRPRRRARSWPAPRLRARSRRLRTKTKT